MALSDAIKDIQKKVKALEGIQAAPDEPVEGINVHPFAVSYARTGKILFASAGWGHYLQTVVCEIHCSRGMLTLAIQRAMPYIESFVEALQADPTLGDTVSTVNEIRYTFGRLEWGEDTNIGIRFEIDVKLHSTTS